MKSFQAAIILAFCASLAVNAAPVPTRVMTRDFQVSKNIQRNYTAAELSTMTEDEIYENTKRALPADQLAALKAAGLTDDQIATFEADEASVASRSVEKRSPRDAAADEAAAKAQGISVEDYLYEVEKRSPRDAAADEAAAKAQGISVEDYLYEVEKRSPRDAAADEAAAKAQGISVEDYLYEVEKRSSRDAAADEAAASAQGISLEDYLYEVEKRSPRDAAADEAAAKAQGISVEDYLYEVEK